MSSFVDILKPTPTADVIHENRFKGCSSLQNIVQKVLHRYTPLEHNTASSRICIRFDDTKSVKSRVFGYQRLLPFQVAFLKTLRRPEILSGGNQYFARQWV